MATKTGIYYMYYTPVDNIKITLDAIFNIDNLPILNITRTLSESYHCDPDNILGHRSGYIGGGIFTVSSFTVIDNNTIEVTAETDIAIPTFTIHGYTASENNYIQEGALIFIDDYTSAVYGVNYFNETFTDEHEYSSWEIDGSEAYLNGDYNYIAQISGNTLTIYTQDLLRDKGNEELIKCNYTLNYTVSEKQPDKPDPDEPDDTLYIQYVYVRFEDENGIWGDYELITDPTDEYLAGETYYWSRQSDETYQFVEVEYIVNGEKENYVDIHRNRYLQQVWTKYQNADGSWSKYNLEDEEDCIAGAIFSWHRDEDESYKTVNYFSSEPIYDKISHYVDIYRKTIEPEEEIDQSIYLYSNGKCYAKEFIEEETGFGIHGEVYNASFNEVDYINEYVIDKNKFIAFEFIEGLPE